VSLRQDFKAVKPVITVALITFLKDWLSKHIKGMDQKYDPLMINKGTPVSL
jgi:hemerythrin